MKLHVWKTVGGLLFCLGVAGLASAGCSSSSTPASGPGGSSGGVPIPAGCNSDDGLDCSGGGTGVSCPTGTTPDPSAGVCSDPSDQGGGVDGFCCIAFADPGCGVDDTVTGCEYPSYGFSCASGSADPSADDDSLTCSTPTTDPNGNDDYCCVDNGGGGGGGGGGIPAGCASDSGLDCSGGGTGISCPSGDTPDDSAGVCSDPSDQGDGTDGFCCIAFADPGCTQDDTVTGCDYPSYGFSCAGGSTPPDTDDTSLTCSTPTSDPNGNDDYCCVDN